MNAITVFLISDYMEMVKQLCPLYEDFNGVKD